MRTIRAVDAVGPFGIRFEDGERLFAAAGPGDEALRFDFADMEVATQNFCWGFVDACMKAFGPDALRGRVEVHAGDVKIERRLKGAADNLEERHSLDPEARAELEAADAEMAAEFKEWLDANPPPGPLDDVRLDAIERRALLADPHARSYQGWEAAFVDGAWRVGMKGNLDTLHDAVMTVTGGMVDEPEAKAVAEFTAHAHTDVLDLVRELREARRRLAELEEKEKNR